METDESAVDTSSLKIVTSDTDVSYGYIGFEASLVLPCCD